MSFIFETQLYWTYSFVEQSSESGVDMKTNFPQLKIKNAYSRVKHTK